MPRWWKPLALGEASRSLFMHRVQNGEEWCMRLIKVQVRWCIDAKRGFRASLCKQHAMPREAVTFCRTPILTSTSKYSIRSHTFHQRRASWEERQVVRLSRDFSGLCHVTLQHSGSTSTDHFPKAHIKLTSSLFGDTPIDMLVGCRFVSHFFVSKNWRTMTVAKPIAVLRKPSKKEVSIPHQNLTPWYQKIRLG